MATFDDGEKHVLRAAAVCSRKVPQIAYVMSNGYSTVLVWTAAEPGSDPGSVICQCSRYML